uniref:Peptidase C39-like domain-containing protein n=1 Tax=Chaetoceros debilis TaxID=122233 RepID=A0A7S3QIK3_9STRA|mmetsp:Transcript_27257/g.41766  ORF Transcript_27257/g.41766 Transcript_27257/m.41766 type:complete len:141 (-) Transcript_27257:607-1029(-)|eukprot:CAMPEP_0194091350 /NCGR_PEP_ID=MMETSP0149-20130528/42715_1 /TAXON_ID=122233 /ORGANISM="Chaetoceros debilis, Strain MM31A-1" /LENGTH=140 /DNA_ID=CAMNT_0038775907 /DNA_START=125 /DNA_END=547 /DNA_ORIENTATION=-
MLQICDPPLTIHQDNFDPGKGNALQAAIASLFGLPLGQVPNFIEMPNGYEASINSFSRDGGMVAKKIKLIGSDSCNMSDLKQGELCILRGKSPRGDHGHVVVARWDGSEFIMVHDPHPDGTFLDKVESFGWCMTFQKIQN